jgi:anti-sigma factor RsiW
MTTMSCREFAPSLSDLVDGGLPRDARAKLEAHLEGCADCRALLADLKRVKAAARALPKMTAPESVWQNVRAGLDGELRRSGARRPATVLQFAGWRWRGLTGLAAAAVVVLAVIAGTYYMTRAAAPVTPAPPAPAHESASATVQSIEADMDAAAEHYQKAIAGLEAVAKEGRGTLDPQLAEVLQKNIGVTDQAISESRAAVRAQPTSEVAQASLFEALQRKVSLLRDTIALINEMRKGDQAGAAKVAGSLSKS